ncbi:innexin unc-7-like [Gigantopelta aegis]|uniref:innexin unc-7-like n=1 Tax=Gigantopelta aegis TaxID=1735272 RepID=UPI001B88E774|nr:innexin unc-7-like [Gigantopelta aegis]
MMGLFAARSWLIGSVDGDWVDRANGFWTVFLLSTCAVGALLVRLITTPIVCWVPAHFTASMTLYVQEKCFLQEHYQQHTSDDILQFNSEFSYHLWIPIILFFQAICFFIPNLVWRCLKNPISIDTGSVLSTLEKTKLSITSGSMTTLYHRVALLISNVLRKNNFLLAFLYLGTKILYCVNLLGQFVFLLIYFRQELAIKAGKKAGVDISRYMNPLLLKMGMCSYDIMNKGKVMAYVSQCVLPITETYEKLFVFLWYWVLFLLVITIINLILWSAFLFIPFLRNRKLSIYLRAFSTNSHSNDDESNYHRFISNSLGISGVFMLHSIGNSNEMVAAELTGHLFEEFNQRQPQVIPSGSQVQPEKEEIRETPLETFTISETPYAN